MSNGRQTRVVSVELVVWMVKSDEVRGLVVVAAKFSFFKYIQSYRIRPDHDSEARGKTSALGEPPARDYIW